MMRLSIRVAVLAATAVAGRVVVEKRLQHCSVDPANTAPPLRCNSADPPYTQPESLLYNNINCDAVAGGIRAVKKPYLLVPATGNGGADSFDNGGYVQLIPPLGYDVCYLVEPKHMLNDAQDTDEHVAYAINTLATIAQQNVVLHGFSQGCLDIQWVLTFWPSALANSDRFLATAADFRGLDLLAVLNLVPNAVLSGQLRARDLRGRRYSGLLSLLPVPLPPGFRQQLLGANYLSAFAKHGGLESKIPTTSIYSSTDDIVSPENSTPLASSYLNGANVGNHLIQSYCPGLRYSHSAQTNRNFTYQVIKAALGQSKGYASQADVRALGIPCNYDIAPGADPAKANAALTIGLVNLAAAIAENGTLVEPPLRAYAR